MTDGASRAVERVRVAAGLLLLWTVAFASEPGRIVADTKVDLALNPVGLMSRSLHLWDGAATFGTLQNQAYGYLFPMGPFAVLGQVAAEPWLVQRLWWATLLSVGYLTSRRLFVALDVGETVTRHLAALAFALSPRVLSTLGPISSEAGPALLAPAILLPLILASRAEVGVRRGAAVSGVAVLCCGGVNATATLFAIVPAALWLLTRRRWWRASLTWWWVACVFLATLWWVVPLVVLGRYSPPFLAWIESADAVTRYVSLLDGIRGTSHWLGHLVTTGGPWWNAGFELVTRPGLIVATAIVAGVGLAGLALDGIRERTFLVLTATVGVLVLSLPHAGVLTSPLSGEVQALLDGPLAPLRNVHKADPLLRLPLAVGLAHATAALRDTVRARRRDVTGRGPVLRAAALLTVAAAIAVAAVPGLAGRLASRGSFTEVPAHWVDAGRWLDAHGADGVSLIVPAANFGEYSWGRPMDEVLRSLTRARIAVRDAVPLTPANTIRMLDSIETRLQTGRELGGAVEVLRRSGVRFLVLRNDLDTSASGGPPSALARASLRATPGLSLARGFGSSFLDGFADRVQPVEVYAIDSAPREARASLQPAADLVVASGAAESLADLADSGLVTGPVVFGADLAPGSGLAAVDRTPLRVVTDGFRARNRGFGSPRGRDVGAVLTSGEAAAGVRDYLPWPHPALATSVAYDGLRALRATTSLAQVATPGGLDPAVRPFAAVDGDAVTAWVALAADAPALELTFTAPRSLEGLEISPLADRDRYGDLLGIPTRLRIEGDHGTVAATLLPTGEPQRVAVPPGATSKVTITVLETDRPRAIVTGLATVRLPGLVVRESTVVPPGAAGVGPGGPPADGYVLTHQLGGDDGCHLVRGEHRCAAGQREPESPTGMDRTLPVGGQGRFSVAGTLTARPGPTLEAVLDADAPAVVNATSRRSRAPQARPGAVLDGDPATAWSPEPGDTRPGVTMTFAEPVTVHRLRLDVRDEWLRDRKATVQVSVDGRRRLAEVADNGEITVATMVGRTVTVRLLLDATDADADPATRLEVAELMIEGVSGPAPSDGFATACGSGPRLLVDGALVPTRVRGPREAAYGSGVLEVDACRLVMLREPQARVVLEPWAGFVAERLVLVGERARDAGGPTSGAGEPARTFVIHGDGSRARAEASLTMTVGSGAASLLSLAQNTNPGWVASFEGRPLDRVTLDGWRQAFLLPAGEGGTLSVTFAPDRVYRWALLSGFGLVLLLGLTALAPSRRRVTSAVPARLGRSWWLAIAVAAPALLAGWWGLLVGAACVGGIVGFRRWGGRLRRHAGWSLPALAGSLVMACGVLQAIVAPGRLGPAWLEGTIRMAVLAGLGLVWALTGFAHAPTSSRDVRAHAR